MSCKVHAWIHKKSFPDAERRRIQDILADWGFTDVVKVRYKPTTDTIVVWTGREPHDRVFVTDGGETAYCRMPSTLHYHYQ